jgi:hypothetical protein
MKGVRAKAIWHFAESCPLPVSMCLCAVAGIGLSAYASGPVLVGSGAGSGATVSLAGALGGVLPVVGLAIVVSRVVRDRSRFRLSVLLQSYVALALAFAVLYASLQASNPAFHGMEELARATPDSLAQLYAIAGDSLYLSVVTITTLGYGDLAPTAPVSKLFTALEALSGIAFMSVALGHYFSVCTSCGATGDADTDVRGRTN